MAISLSVARAKSRFWFGVQTALQTFAWSGEFLIRQPKTGGFATL